MPHYISPLSSSASPTLPERLSAVTPQHDITVAETYLRNGIPHIVLSHLLWDFRIHFAVRWMSREVNQLPVALLEIVGGVYDGNQVPQIFVYVTGRKSVSLVPEPLFNRMVHNVFRTITSNQSVSRIAANQKLVNDVRNTFGASTLTLPAYRKFDFGHNTHALICASA